MDAKRLQEGFWRRHGLTVAVAAGIVVELAVAAMAVVTHDSARPVTIDDAVGRFRQQQVPVAAGVTPSATASPTAGGPRRTPSATPTAAAAKGSQPTAKASATAGNRASSGGSSAPTLPAAGVYTYDAKGYEQANTPIGAERHDYAGPHPLTVASGGCGRSEQLDFTTQRWDRWEVCLDGRAELLRFRTTAHEFKGHTDQRTYTCTAGSHDRPAADAPGSTASAHCPSGGNSQSGAATLDYRVRVVAREKVPVGGQSVAALHLRLDETFSGATTGTAREDRWIDPRTNLILRWTRVEDTKSRASGGGFVNVTVPYHEEYSLTLRSLEPRT